MPAKDDDRSTPPPLPEPLAVAVADSHTHLDMQAGTPAEGLGRAASVGVTTVVQVGCDVPGSRWAAELAAQYEQVHAAVALHPNEAPRIFLGDHGGTSQPSGAGGGWSGQRRPAGGRAALDEALAEIDALAALPQVLAVGETGLDYFRTGPEGVEIQKESFRRHIEMAKRHGKALVIHDRDAHEDVIAVLLAEGAPDRTVFHCYSGDAEMAKVCAEHGWYLSFAGPVTFKANQPLRDALLATPLDRILVETDAPFLTPHPYRGRPNAPYLIPVTVRSMAATLGLHEDELSAAIAENTARAFGY
ncbi:TatD family hydrolase [Kitasatospora sp. NPDC048194]|uniref:TatD family hydrolase n=1 Tax=Kitasatospora sp. NPDC048194 TaxID=3364045 RepID=UPI00372343F6